MHALERGSVYEEYVEPLIYIICALGARYYSSSHGPKIAGQSVKDGLPGGQWAASARRMAMEDMVTPSVQTLMVSPGRARLSDGVH